MVNDSQYTLGFALFWAFKWSTTVSTPEDFHCFGRSNGQQKSVHLGIFSVVWRSNGEQKSVHLRMFDVFYVKMDEHSQYTLGF